MHAFVALLWHADHPSACHSAHKLLGRMEQAFDADHPCIKAPGFVLFDLGSNTTRDTIIRVNGADHKPVGAIFGTLFRRSNALAPSRPITNFAQDEMLRLSRSRNECVLSDYWGSYLAFHSDQDGGSVIADPTSSIPCFFLVHQGVLIVFSHLEKCTFIDPESLSLNYKFVSDLLAYDKIQSGATGFNEIEELRGGEKLVFHGPRLSRHLIWDPRVIASNHIAPCFEDAAAELRATTRYVVQCWASAFDQTTVSLSGGLDSSIVLSCLSDTPFASNVRAIHFVMGTDDLTEVEFARASALKAKLPLKEIQFGALNLPRLDSHPRSARPFRKFLTLIPKLADIADILSPDSAILTGQGGDHLFRARTTTLGFADFLIDSGVSRNALRELLNSARLSRKSIWAVLREAIPSLAPGARKSTLITGIEHACTPVNRGAFASLDPRTCAPVWALEANGLPPAKFEQVSTLIHLFLVRETLDQPFHRNFVHPLISQPLIELCLRLPIYLLCWNGVSRGLVREAFKGEIPDCVRTRTAKGASTQFFVKQVTSNIAELREALLNGRLVEAKLLSRNDVSKFATVESVQTHEFGHKMLIYYTIEAWLRNWIEKLENVRTSA